LRKTEYSTWLEWLCFLHVVNLIYCDFNVVKPVFNFLFKSLEFQMSRSVQTLTMSGRPQFIINLITLVSC